MPVVVEEAAEAGVDSQERSVCPCKQRLTKPP
jgi:hypothetical protein